MNRFKVCGLLLCVAAMLGLAGCGGGGNGSIGGSVSGLASGASVTLQNNSSNTLTVSGNGPFTFGTELSSGATYTVTVLTQPSGQLCTVANGSGTVDSNGDPVKTVTVVCVSTSTVGGTVAGLQPGTSVSLYNGTVTLLTGNGTFAFPGSLAVGATYQVTVAVQPAIGGTCTVNNGSGTVVAGGTINIQVVCS